MRLKTVSTLTGAMLRTVRADIGANDGLPREYTVFFQTDKACGLRCNHTP